VPASASIWPSLFAARPALLTAAARFYEAEVVAWLLKLMKGAQVKVKGVASIGAEQVVYRLRAR
jgi:hypothetical protein